MKPRRPHIPVMVKLQAALMQLGLEPHAVELDHDPALALRPIDPETGDTVPAANDPKYLVWRPKAEHAIKTTGRRGESRLGDQANGDIQRAAKVKRISAKQERFRASVLSVSSDLQTLSQQKPKSKIPSRPFPKRKK
jgi:hypothetical protein